MDGLCVPFAADAGGLPVDGGAASDAGGDVDAGPDVGGDAGRPIDGGGQDAGEPPPPPGCPTTEVLGPDADVLLTDAASVAAFADVTRSLRDVRIEGAAQGDTVSLPNLVHIGSRLEIEPGAGVFTIEVELPCLTTVVDRVEINGARWPNVELPALVSVGDRLIMKDELVTALLPSLTTVGGWLQLDNSPALTDAAWLSGVQTVDGELLIRNNPLMPTCQAEELRDRLIANGWRRGADIRNLDDVPSCPHHAADPCPPEAVADPCPGGEARLDLNTDQDVVDARDITCATSVFIEAGVTDVCLPKLMAVTGLLDLNNGTTTTTSIRLPALRQAGELELRGDLVLSVLEAPRLQTVTGDVLVRDFNNGEGFVLEALRDVDGEVHLGPTPASLVYLPALRTVGLELHLQGLQQATQVLAPRLLSTGILEITASPLFSTFVGYSPADAVGGLLVRNADSLRDLTGLGASPITGAMWIENNDDLLSLTPLTPADLAPNGAGITIFDNPCLDEPTALEFAAAVPNAAVSVYSNGNGDGCPFERLNHDFASGLPPHFWESPGVDCYADANGAELALGCNSGIDLGVVVGSSYTADVTSGQLSVRFLEVSGPEGSAGVLKLMMPDQANHIEVRATPTLVELNTTVGGVWMTPGSVQPVTFPFTATLTAAGGEICGDIDGQSIGCAQIGDFPQDIAQVQLLGWNSGPTSADFVARFDDFVGAP